MIEYQEGVTLAEIEWQYIQSALEYYGGNKSEAARGLGPSLKTIYNRIDKNAPGKFTKGLRGRKNNNAYKAKYDKLKGEMAGILYAERTKLENEFKEMKQKYKDVLPIGTGGL